MVGAGPAGDAAAFGLRDGGFRGEVTLVGSETELPYERPHLSKGYLLGTVSRDQLGLRPAHQYAEQGIDLWLGRRAVELDVDRRVVRLEDGGAIGWEVVCITIGSEARRLDRGIQLRELPAAERLKRLIDSGSSLDILGAGFIGCEVAAVAAAKGCAVRVYEALEQPMRRVVGPDVGAYLADVHREHGVELHLGETIANADLVAIGSAPRRLQGVHGDAGIAVDELGRTPAPGVYAAGDVTRFFHPLYGQPIRVEHFQTSQRHGFAVGRSMAGVPTRYEEVPWFWSDQYDLNLQYAGAALPWDETVARGEVGRPPFTVFYLAGGSVVGALGVNDHHTVARARHAMQRRVALSRDQLQDPGFDLRRASA